MRHALLVAFAVAAMGIETTLAADGDPAAGEKAFKTQCGTCHTVEPGKNRTGPSLAGIMGKTSGTQPGYVLYSKELKAAALTWDPSTLDAYLTDPRAKVPGTRMINKVADAKTRADIIAYLAAQP